MSCRGASSAIQDSWRWRCIEYARALDNRGLLASARKFVERAFGMKVPTTFAAEAAPLGGLFDFSSTTATRMLAVVAAEGATPFVGAWLRERVAASTPRAFTPRRLDENSWNGCAAWALGRAYVVSTDPVFLEGYSAILDEIERRDRTTTGRSAATKRCGWPRRRRRFITRWRSTRWSRPRTPQPRAGEAGSARGR